jgi:hypothetical protein
MDHTSISKEFGEHYVEAVNSDMPEVFPFSHKHSRARPERPCVRDLTSPGFPRPKRCRTPRRASNWTA